MYATSKNIGFLSSQYIETVATISIVLASPLYSQNDADFLAISQSRKSSTMDEASLVWKKPIVAQLKNALSPSIVLLQQTNCSLGIHVFYRLAVNGNNQIAQTSE